VQSEKWSNHYGFTAMSIGIEYKEKSVEPPLYISAAGVCVGVHDHRISLRSIIIMSVPQFISTIGLPLLIPICLANFSLLFAKNKSRYNTFKRELPYQVLRFKESCNLEDSISII
jgi:hypothetical protein